MRARRPRTSAKRKGSAEGARRAAGRKAIGGGGKRKGGARRAPAPPPPAKKRGARPSRPASRKAGPPGVVVGVGLATVDLIGVAPRTDERLVELSVFSMQGGGSAANMLSAAATLGSKTRFFGRLGDDSFGGFALEGLSGVGVDTSLVDIERRKVSPVSIVNIDEFTRRRRISFTRGSVSPLEPKNLPRGLLAGASLLCLDGYQPALQAAIAEKAREQGIPVLLNAGHLVGGMGELLALSDIVIGSERFASEFAPSDQVEKSLREITRVGPRVAVITLGAEGAMGLEGETLVQQEPIDVFVADTTGAGDVFCGAFAHAWTQGWPLERALPFANAAAGLHCRSLGPRAGLPTLTEVMEVLEEG